MKLRRNWQTYEDSQSGSEKIEALAEADNESNESEDTNFKKHLQLQPMKLSNFRNMKKSTPHHWPIEQYHIAFHIFYSW